MNKEPINWKTFKDTLLLHPDLNLQFQYAAGKMVDASYHITKIKQAPVTSVDCGGVMNAWTEIIIQLWVPENEEHERSMKVSKALSIIAIVEKMLPLDPDGLVKIEFGYAAFDTRQMFPDEMIMDGNSLVIGLRSDVVQCKALSRGSNCSTEKPKAELKHLAAAGAGSCSPDGGCC